MVVLFKLLTALENVRTLSQQYDVTHPCSLGARSSTVWNWHLGRLFRGMSGVEGTVARGLKAAALHEALGIYSKNLGMHVAKALSLPLRLTMRHHSSRFARSSSSARVFRLASPTCTPQ